MDLQPGFSKAKCECIYSQLFSETKWHNASTANFSKAKWPNTSTDDSMHLQPISSNAKWLHASTTIFFSNAKWLNTSTANFHVFFKSWVTQCIYNLFFINGSTHLRTTLSNANWFNASTTNFVFSNKWLNASTLLFFQMLSPPIYLIIQSCIDLLIYLFIWFI